MSRLWVTWEDHRRSRELASHFSAELCVLASRRNRLVRYLVLSSRTLAALVKRRPATVFCQNPSLILACLLAVLRPLFRYRLVVDRHSSFKLPTRHLPQLKWRWFHRLSDYSLRQADVTIVTNTYLKNLVESRGGRGFVLQDKLPDLRSRSPRLHPGVANIVFICTFSDDEPLAEVFGAARELGPGYLVQITGRKEKFLLQYDLPLPENVSLTGFLPEDEYVDLLAGADALLILTNADYVLNCGSYEGVALGKPMILSATETIREYFSRGAVYVDLDEHAIAAGIRDLVQDIDRYRAEIKVLKQELLADWDRRAREFSARELADRPGDA